jgi:hypothetical protein
MNHPELFEILARTTWATIEAAARNRIQYGEDAITSVNLNALASSPDHSVVVEDTRVDEAIKGCDFEFWIGSDSSGWARYAIQAKKLSLPTSSYTKLGHKVGGNLQLDILERYARANRAAALYCFYNHSTLSHKWHCGFPIESAQLGCSITPASVVKAYMRKRGQRTFQALHAHPSTLPWRCLVRCPRLAVSRTLCHTGWPATEAYFYRALPTSIQVLAEERDGSVLVDAQEAFDSQVGLRPRWVGVFRIDYDGILR